MKRIVGLGLLAVIAMVGLVGCGGGGGGSGTSVANAQTLPEVIIPAGTLKSITLYVQTTGDRVSYTTTSAVAIQGSFVIFTDDVFGGQKQRILSGNVEVVEQ